MWIEKTPDHRLYLPEIERHVPGARFVHVVREGMDVLAKIADANLHCNDNHGFGGGTKPWAQRRNQAATIHARSLDRPNHHVVFLDDFIRDTRSAWLRLCAALALDGGVPLADSCEQPIADFAREPWRGHAIGGTLSPPRRKAATLLGPDLQDWLSRQLVSLEPLRRRCRERDRHGAGRGGRPISRARTAGFARPAPRTTGPA